MDIRTLAYLVSLCSDKDKISECFRNQLYFTAKNGDAGKVIFLLRRGVNPGMTCLQGKTALCLTNSPKIMKILLAHPETIKTINHKNIHGDTALNINIRTCNVEAVKMLISAGAATNIGDPKPLNRIKDMLMHEPKDTERCLRLLEIQQILEEHANNTLKK